MPNNYTIGSIATRTIKSIRARSVDSVHVVDYGMRDNAVFILVNQRAHKNGNFLRILWNKWYRGLYVSEGSHWFRDFFSVNGVSGMERVKLVALSPFFPRILRFGDRLCKTSWVDDWPFHFVSQATLDNLSRNGTPLDPLRFRAIVVNGLEPQSGSEPWKTAEESWKVIRVNGIMMDAVARTPRCPITRIDPATGAGGPEPERTARKDNRILLGKDGRSDFLIGVDFVHRCQPDCSGIIGQISIGDEVEVIERFEPGEI